jgi:hypothetical protein
MTAVSAGNDPAELLVAIGMAVAGLALIRPAVHGYVARFNRHLLPPATTGARALRRGRVSLPSGLSPKPAGSELAAHSQTTGGRQAVETHTPDSVSTAPGEQQ